MGKTKLISVRLDQETLEKIDKVANNYKRGRRSQVINAILKNILECSTEYTLDLFIREYDAFSSGYTVQFTK